MSQLIPVTSTPPSTQLTVAIPSCTFQDLPEELILRIFAELGVRDALAASSVCWQWNTLLGDNSLWKYFFCRDFESRTSVPQMQSFQENYIRRHTLHANLSKGICRQRILDTGRDVHSGLLLANGFLISHTNGISRKIKVWNVDTGDCLATFVEKSNCTVLAFANGQIISGLENGAINIWNIESGNCLTLEGHQNFVKQLVVADEMLISESADGTIKIWNRDTGACLHTLQAGIISPFLLPLVYTDRKLFVGTSNKIEVWNVDTGARLNPLEETVSSLLIADQRIISGSYNNEIKISDLAKGECLMTINKDDLNYDYVTCLATIDKTIISGHASALIKIWDRETGKCLKTLKEQKDEISTIFSIGDGMIGSCSTSNEIKIWEMKTGSCLYTSPLIARALIKNAIYADGMIFRSFMKNDRSCGIEILDFNRDLQERPATTNHIN